MSDFTKEELEIILEGILWRDNHVHPNKRPEELKYKIQSMIEDDLPTSLDEKMIRLHQLRHVIFGEIPVTVKKSCSHSFKIKCQKCDEFVDMHVEKSLNE